MKFYKEYTKEPYSFLVSDMTLPSDNPTRFRKNLLQNDTHFEKSKQYITKSSKAKLNTT